MRLAPGFIPCAFWFTKLIILLGIIGTVIARLTQVNREGLDVLWQLSVATHVMGTNGRLVHAGNNA